MLKYITENNTKYLYDNINLERDNNINDYSIFISELEEIKNCFSPQNMTRNNYNNEFIAISDNDTGNNYPLYFAFNHTDNNYIARLGNISNTNYKNIYFNFFKSRNLQYIKFKIHEINSSFNITLYGSNDYEINNPEKQATWFNLDKCNIGFDQQINNINSICYFDNKSQGNFLNGNPVIICKFNNQNYYKNYRLLIKSNSESSQELKISKMKLYDQNSYYNSIIHFPFNNNISNSENEIIGQSNAINFITEQNCIYFNTNSSLNYPFIFPYNLNQCSIAFMAKFNTSNLSGAILSKNKNEFTFSVKQDIQNINNLIFSVSIQNNIYDFNILKEEIQDKWTNFFLIFSDNLTIYINKEKQLEQSLNVNPFNSQFKTMFNIGCTRNDNNINIDFIKNMKLKNLSIYDFPLTLKEINKYIRKFKI